MTEAFFAAWLRAFVVTQAVEVPVYALGARAPLTLSFAASAVTHPVVWFVFFGPIGLSVDMEYAARTLLAEVFAWLVEAAMLTRLLPPAKALGWSLVANAASVVVGFALRALIGFP